MKHIYIYRKRAFLDPASTNHTSYILAHVENSHGGTEKYGTNLIFIADCHRVIQLEFYIGTKEHRRISLRKIDLLIDVLTRFREALAKEIAQIEKPK
jgi:hypothetical protein